MNIPIKLKQFITHYVLKIEFEVANIISQPLFNKYSNLKLIEQVVTSFFDRIIRKIHLQAGEIKLIIWGLQIFLGAFGFRRCMWILLYLWKIVAKRSVMTISRATGHSVSDGKRATWRVTAPINEIKYSTLNMIDICLYGVEVVGLTAITTGMTLAVFSPPKSTGNLIVDYIGWLMNSVMGLRPIRICYDYPDVIFGIIPLVYAYNRYTAISGSKGKVTVTTIVNNYLGTGIIKKQTQVDLAEVAIAVRDASGITYAATEFLSFRDSVYHVGLKLTATSYFNTYRRNWNVRQLVDPGNWFIALTWPIAVACTTIVGFRRNRVVPEIETNTTVSRSIDRGATQAVIDKLPQNPFRFERTSIMKSNRLVAIMELPGSLPLEIFTGNHVLRPGAALPEIAVSSSDLLRVKLPMKPVCNNTFAFDLMKRCTGHWVLEIEKLMKVPPTPFHAAVEIQKYCLPEIDYNYDTYSITVGMTEKEYLVQFMKKVLRIEVGDIIRLPRDLDVKEDDYLNSDTKKRHPGWRTRAFFGQTKHDAWVKSAEVAKKVHLCMQTDAPKELKDHVWLFLPVVKKNGSRKDLYESRCRGAAIPELYLQILWMYHMKPLSELIKSKGIDSWMAKFELFHKQLTPIYNKFDKGLQYSNEDKVDHGASLRAHTADIIVEFIGSIIQYQGEPGLGKHMIRSLMDEMITGCVGLPDKDGDVHIYKTLNGIFDGVYGTSDIGGLYTIIGEGHKIWRNYHRDATLREKCPDIFKVSDYITGQVSGDNSLFGYPTPLGFMSGVHPDQAKYLAEIGLIVKLEETLFTNDLNVALCMSWNMENISESTIPLVIGWKPTHEMLKGFFYPEKLLDYDFMSIGTRKYLAEIIVALYIMGYWNIEVREFLVVAWQILWKEQEECMIGIEHISDFQFKTGLDPAVIEPVSSMSMVPYPNESIVKLWLDSDNVRIATRRAKHGPTPQVASSSIRELLALRESGVLHTISQDVTEMIVANVDTTMMGLRSSFSMTPYGDPSQYLSFIDPYLKVIKMLGDPLSTFTFGFPHEFKLAVLGMILFLPSAWCGMYFGLSKNYIRYGAPFIEELNAYALNKILPMSMVNLLQSFLEVKFQFAPGSPLDRIMFEMQQKSPLISRNSNGNAIGFILGKFLVFTMIRWPKRLWLRIVLHMIQNNIATRA